MQPNPSSATAAAGALEARLRSGGYAITAEVTPPLSTNPEDLVAAALPLRGLAHAVNVTDAASAHVHPSSLAVAALLQQRGIEPVMQMTCRDRNRIALQCDLLGAAALGIRNLLALRGDDVAAGDQPEAKPVFDLDSGALIAAAAGMAREGTLPSGRAVSDPPRFFVGAADTPIDPPPGWRPDRLRAKIEAGAGFVQTQFCFDLDVIRRYAARLREEGLTERAFVLVGIGPIASARSAQWMRAHLGGTIIPDAVIDRLAGARDPRDEGIAICAELMQALADVPGIAGAHLMSPRNDGAIAEAIRAAGVVRSGREEN